MNSLKNLKIGARLGLAFATLIALALLVGLIGVSRLSQLNESLALIGSDRVPKVQKTADITDNVNLIARELRNALIFNDAGKVNAALDAAREARESIAKTLDALAPTITSDEGKKRLAAVQAARGAYVPIQT